ncbi:VHS-domain-containing protein [Pluteus cervinus]|uniref:VHS-domain-containing protein n=1 Tax=Pluteus cervinus TaxID=181527 RepID=A0ACD3AUG9_9AGAR|nr:VHS-domain-containing protein [Pluteus cervinus]
MLGNPNSWLRISPIETLITRACDPSLHEPNYALHLEVAEYINSKKANNPREAAILIARLANHRNPHIASLALALLDTLVQSCGYPFHLQISTKEFLNELVRRFPERPPPFPPPVMTRILDLIHGWKEGICHDSRWKDDLGNIRDMHRLLSFKGYRFREVQRAQALSVAANLKSADELEEEDREAQSAKLQELIRRGTPRDLAAAQELMKALAGANPDAKPDYRSQALTELNKLEQKVILLNEMLDNVDQQRGERFASGDAYDQVSAILISARPKLQKWISDAQTDDPESLDTFLQINDQINTVLSRYEAFKKGDYAAAANPIPAELSQKSDQGLSLIDLDDSAGAGAASASGGVDDLAGLFAAPSTSTSAAPRFGMTGGAASAQKPPTYQPTPLASNGSSIFSTTGPSQGSIIPPQSSTPPASIMLPITPGQRFATPTNVGNSAPIRNNNTALPGGSVFGAGLTAFPPQQSRPQPQTSQQWQQTPANPNSNQVQGKDPFADLAGLF